MDTREFATAFIEARGGLEEMEQDEKEALVRMVLEADRLERGDAESDSD